MNVNMLVSAVALLAGSLLAADSTPKEDITNAAKKLAEKPNYSWRTTVVVPESAQFKPGPTEGKTEKEGFTHLKMSFGDNTAQAVIKGDKAAFSGQDGGWRSLSELENDEGPGRFFVRFFRSFKPPAAHAVVLASAAKELKKDGDVYSGELTEDGAKAEFRFGNPSNAKGSVKFWLNNGALAKYEFKVQGKVDFNGNEVDVDRATTIEIKDVGATKVEVPDEAKDKLK